MKKIVYDMKVVSDGYQNLAGLNTLVVAAGSDFRAYEALRSLKNNTVEISDLFLFEFEERLTQIELGDPYYEFEAIGFKDATRIPCSLRYPKSCLDHLLLHKDKFSERSVGIDISCFTKPFFFYLLKLFKERFKIRDISVFYTEPKSYLFPKGVFSSYHSTIGPLSILEIPGYSGFEKRGESRILVILLGFEGDLSRVISDDVSPSETLAVNGFPGYYPKFKDVSLIANEKLITNEDVTVCYARANNPFEVFNLLERIQAEKKDSFINVAPLGTKPMALGACLFALHYPSARIVYPFPESYERVTTDMCWNTWMYSIPLHLD